MRFPLVMRKLEGGQILSRFVADAEEEAGLAAEGWSPKVPEIPAPPVEPVPLTDDTASAIATILEGMAELGAQIAEIGARVDKLEAKRGPGRPPREAN